MKTQCGGKEQNQLYLLKHMVVMLHQVVNVGIIKLIAPGANALSLKESCG